MKQAFLAPIGTFLLILIASLFVAVRANAINELDNIQIKQTNSFAFSHPKLKDVIVTSALQDNRGQLWIGSEEWLYRYDGFFVEKIDHKYDKNGEASTVPTGIISRLVQLDERYLLVKSS